MTLQVIVPRNRRRVAAIVSAVAGTEIRMLVDRRRRERRATPRGLPDRRGQNRVTGYIRGCPIVVQR